MIGTLTMDDLSKVRRMAPTDAEVFLRGFILTSEEHEQAMLLAGKNLAISTAPKGITYDASRRKWLLAAWLAGASWRQLAYLHQIAPQTAISSVDRIMPSAMRQKHRLKKSISLEKLSAYRRHYIDNAVRYDEMEPVAIAEDLLSVEV